MKARRLVLCLFLSLALIVTFIPIISFADDDYGEEGGGPNFSDFSDLVDSATLIEVEDEVDVNGETLFVFTPDETGMYMFYSLHDYDEDASESDPIARVLDENGEIITEDDDSYGDFDFRVVFKATKDQTYYLHVANYKGNAACTVYLDYSSITGASFVPTGEHLIYASCDDSYGYWNDYIDEYVEGDKLILTENGSKITYTYKRILDEYGDEYFGFFDSEENRLLGDPYLYVNDENYAPKASNKGGSVKTVAATFEYMGFQANVSVKVKFVYKHPEYSLVQHAAVAPTCTVAGSKEYWQCNCCHKFFTDKNGVNEIAANGLVIPGGHKWQHVKKAAGLMKNGVQYDQCTVCGAKQNSSVIPGWSKYFVKAPKTVAGKKSFTVKWGKQSKANLKKFNGYQIRYSTKKSMAKSKMVKAGKTAKLKKVSGLKGKTKYFVQVRTYTKKSGKTFYSKWSAKKTVKTK